MIASFDDRGTEDLYNGVATRRARRIPIELHRVARRKLDMIEYAHSLPDLKAPPGNRLEALRSKLKGYHSIRVNDQWRIIFRWDSGNAYDVEIVDYHK